MTCPDNTLRIGEVNTPRIEALAKARRMKNEMKADRLRQARIKAGYESAVDAADAFGWGVAGYRHHENGTRGYGPDAAKKYARAFRVKAGWLLGMDGVDDAPPTDYQTEEKLIVDGAVAAGVWREPSEYSDRFEIDTPSPVKNAKRFGVTVEGYSMDLHYEPGTVLDCISIFANGVRPETGDHVIAERIKADGLREKTVKEFVERDGKFYIRPCSTKPEFQGEIEVGFPDVDHVGDDLAQVVGFVVSSIPPRALRLLERLGKVRKL
jgi:SOS-response transcriptional repressor LexA